MHRDDYKYLYYVNKFIRGMDVSQKHSYCDIETKTTLYEVKGVKVYHINTCGSISLGQYQIDIEHHNQLKEEADKKNKKAKYLIVLNIGERMIFKSVEWTSIHSAILQGKNQFERKDNGRQIFKLNLREVW